MDVETQTDPEEQSETSTDSCVSTVTRMDAETQTEEFDYLLNARPSGYKAPDKDFFDTDEKIRFYTSLPVCGFDIHSFKDLLIVDGGDGCPTVSPSFLARQGKTMEDNAHVLSVCVW